MNSGDGTRRLPVCRNLPPTVTSTQGRYVRRTLTANRIRHRRCRFAMSDRLFYRRTEIIPIARSRILIIIHSVDSHHGVSHVGSRFVTVIDRRLHAPLATVHKTLNVLGANILGSHPRGTRRLLRVSLTGARHLVHLIGSVLSLRHLASNGVALIGRTYTISSLVRVTVSKIRTLTLRTGIAVDYHPIGTAL